MEESVLASELRPDSIFHFLPLDLGQVTSPPRAQFPHLTNDKNRIVRFKWDLWRVMGYSKVLKCHLYLYLKAWKPLRK